MLPIDEQLCALQDHPDSLNQVLQALLTTELYCLGEMDAVGATADDADLMIISWEDPDGNSFVPCFTSLENMSIAMDEDSPYVVLQGHDLFSLMLDETVIVNPELTNELALSPEELKQLVKH